MSVFSGPFSEEGAAEGDIWFLSSLTLAQGTAWGNSENTRTSVTMESNGVQAILGNGAAATINSIQTGFGHVWPISLVRDIYGSSLVAPFNMGAHNVRAACLSRSFSALPLQAGVVFGFCDNADPTLAQQLVALGNSWETTTLCKTVAAKKIGGTQTLTRGTTGQATCAGTECLYNPHGINNVSGTNHNPLGTDFLPISPQNNQTTHSVAVIPVDALTHIFSCFFYSVAAATATPTLRADLALQISTRLPWS